MTTYKGWDVTLEMAEELAGTYSVIGKARSISVEVSSGIEPIYGVGNRDPVILKEGRREITGSLERVFFDSTYFDAIGAATDYQPSFRIRAKIGAGPDMTLTLEGVKFETWSPDMPQDDYLVESLDFRAKSISLV